MRCLVQRVNYCQVRVAGEVVGEIGKGLCVFVGVTHSDTAKEAAYLAAKCVNLRIFEDEDGKMNLSLNAVNGGIIAISQFTLYGNAEKSRRPDFLAAAPPEQANALYQIFLDELRKLNIPVAAGRFRADMAVKLENDGPVTLMLERNAAAI
ncbi:MAG: D-aminoacyl-tRNA deacylase [Victivallaceae bacterium]|nr:D-aminoacyl-tRNA deacylase [Victivallaceae bacterium]